MKRLAGQAALFLCGLADAIPGYRDGRWHRYGDWGCAIGLSRLGCWLDPP